MKRLIIFLLLFAAIKVAGQTIGYLRFDTVMIYKQGGTAELVLMNKTKDTLGLLTNYGNGRTRFIKSRAINDSTIVVGLDTLVIRGATGGSGGGPGNENIGTGYPWLKVVTQEIKRAGNSPTIFWDSIEVANTLIPKVDTFAIATRNRLNKVADSVIQKSREELIDSLDKVTQVRHPLDVIPGANNSIPDTIILTYDGTLDTTASGELTVNPAIIPSVNPGVYFSPAQFANPAFMVFAVGIVRPTNSFSHGADITWDIINYTSDHNSSFFDSAYGNVASGRLYVRYPNVKYVLNGQADGDEIFSQQNVIEGASVGLTILQLAAFKNYPVGYTISGNGAGTWTVASSFASTISLSTHNTTTGITGFNVSGATLWGTDYNGININYVGTNSYRIQRAAAFGAYNIAFKLVDEAGNPVTIDPSTDDQITISNAGLQSSQVSLATWLNNNNSFMNTSSNFWVTGIFECWMVAAATSTTAVQVRWQTDYPSATNYKIYRSSTGLYGTFTLIHTGTSGTYSDTGLTPGTLYTYKLVAVVGGVDTDVTTFNANTKL